MSGGWNYRVRCSVDASGDLLYDFIECYYDEHDNIIGWCEAGPIVGESLYELHGEMQQLLFTATGAIVATASDPRRSLIPADHLPSDLEGQRFDEEGEPLDPAHSQGDDR